MPLVPPTSPATGLPTPEHYIHTTSFSFVDVHGRTLLLRGVNLSGSSKAPPGQLSHTLDDFWESAERGGVSFVGRPLRLEDGSADVHLARLRGWGFNLLRFPFTWEALEHEGPGKYDYEFMDYTIQVLVKCKEYGFKVYMDPHQDTWSRFSGGSGAPYWTLPACGINPANITATQAAILHCEYPSPSTPDPASLPAMLWSTNYGRLLSQTLFTLFFAGRAFAPRCIIDGVNIQEWLQSHFISAVGALVDRIKAWDGGKLLDECVIGWDSLNEPFEGLVGWDDLRANPTAQGSTLKKGTYPTPAQSMRLGMGQKQTVENWAFGAMGPRRDGSVTVDPKGRKVWADPVAVDPSSLSATAVSGELPDGTHPRWGWKRDVRSWPLGTCIWALHGVWDVETGYILQPDYFKYLPSPPPSPTPSSPTTARVSTTITTTTVDFLTDFWKPHWLAFAARIRPSHPEALIFIQPPVFAVPPPLSSSETQGRCVYSPHYYDGLTLITRHWNWFNADALGLLRGRYKSPLGAVKVGEGMIRRSLWEQMGYLREDVRVLGGGAGASGGAGGGGGGGAQTYEYPTLIGEIGTPFDMDHKRSYGWTDGGRFRGDYSAQERALDASLQACDARDEVPKALVRAKGKEGKVKAKANAKAGKDLDQDPEEETLEDLDQEEEEEDTEDKRTRRHEGSLSWTVWTYVPDDHSHEWGDGWNLEDLSLWSVDDLDLGGSEEGSETGLGSEEEEGESEDGEEDGEDREGEDREGEEEEGGALHSRAQLLSPSVSSPRPTHSKKGSGSFSRSVRAQLTRAGSGTKTGTKAKTKSKSKTSSRTKMTTRQPGQSAPMSVTAMSSSVSLDTLHHDGSVDQERRRRRRERRARGRGRGGSISSGSTTSSGSLSSSAQSQNQDQLQKSSHPHPPTNPHSPAHLHPPRKAGYSPNPYVFLTAGARAVRAFARPWPVRVVGKAVEVRFELAKGVFWMKVRVGWEDGVDAGGRGGAVGGGGRVGEGGDRGEEGGDRGEGRERLGTEVYLPLVHFAHERLLDGSFERELEEKEKEEVVDVVRPDETDAASGSSSSGSASGGDRSGSASGESSTLGVGSEEDQDPESALNTTTTTSPDAAPAAAFTAKSISVDIATTSANSTSTHAPLLIKDDTPELIDVEVKVSGGRYEVRGQGLVWWYDVPPRPRPRVSSGSGSTSDSPSTSVSTSTSTSTSVSSSSSSSEKWEYTLEVRRRGGALPAPKPRPKPKPQSKSTHTHPHTATSLARSKPTSSESLCERICCPEDGGILGCVVA